MKTLNQDKLEYWRNHIEQSKQHPDSIQAYCEANNIATSVYYKWRQRVLNLRPSKVISKKVKSAFVPVVVSSSETQSYQRTKSLPDSKWVAEVITSVIRGLL